MNFIPGALYRIKENTLAWPYFNHAPLMGKGMSRIIKKDTTVMALKNHECKFCWITTAHKKILTGQQVRPGTAATIYNGKLFYQCEGSFFGDKIVACLTEQRVMCFLYRDPKEWFY